MKFGYNSKQYDQHATVISPYDHGFLYGMGVFETWRTYGGKSFLFDRHIARLQNSLDAIGICWQADSDRIAAEVTALLTENALTDAYVRLSVSAGIEPLGLPAGEYTNPNELILVKPVGNQPISATPSKAIQLLRTKRLVPETDIRIKSFHYMNSILGKQEMMNYPWATQAEGIMLDSVGDVAEGITSNIFIVKQGRIITPPLHTGILPGITRQFVMEIALENGLEVEQVRFNWSDLLQADEVFITNSVQAIVPIHCVFDQDGHTTSVSIDGSVTKSLQVAYELAVQRGVE